MTDIIWAKDFGGTGHDIGNDIVTDSSSNITYIYTIGSFQSSATFGTKVLNSKGNQDSFVAKLGVVVPTVQLTLEKGDDLIFGNQDTDWLSGDSGNDSIYGGQGDDTLIERTALFHCLVAVMGYENQ